MVIGQLSGILLPVLALAGIGFGWRRFGFPFEREFVTRLIVNVCGPCLIIDSFAGLTLPIADVANMVVAGIAMFVLTITCAWGVLRIARLSVRSYLPALAIGNHGNIGLPLCLFAFGETGLALGVAVFVTTSVGQFMLTPMLQSQDSPIRTLATTPVIYAAAIGTVVFAGDLQLPEWIAASIGLLGDVTIPLMLLALGNTLAGLRAKRLPMALSLGATRLVIGFGLALGVAEIFGLEGVSRSVLILQGAMPAAVFNYLFAARYDRDPDDVASIVLTSTLLSALTLPLLVSYALAIAG